MQFRDWLNCLGQYSRKQIYIKKTVEYILINITLLSYLLGTWRYFPLFWTEHFCRYYSENATHKNMYRLRIL